VKEVFQIIAVCIAVLYTYDFVKGLINKNKNIDAAIEWVSRGYCFGLGLFDCLCDVCSFDQVI